MSLCLGGPRWGNKAQALPCEKACISIHISGTNLLSLLFFNLNAYQASIHDTLAHIMIYVTSCLLYDVTLVAMNGTINIFKSKKIEQNSTNSV